MDSYSLVAVALFGAGLSIVLVLSKARPARDALFLLSVLTIAAGCWAALEHRVPLAWILLVPSFGLAVWASTGARRGQVEPDELPSRNLEPFLLAMVLLVAGLLRFVEIQDFPRWIHGEENIWTWTVGTRWLSNERTWPIPWYSQGVPVSYYQEMVFFKILGPSVWAPRYEVAFFGTLSVALLYGATRKMFGAGPALTAAVLMATSMVALAASRAAFVQSHVLFWTIATLAAYVWAVERRNPWLFLLTGCCLALGSLTYQTFITAVPVIGLHFAYIFVYERRWIANSVNAALLALPLAYVWPRVSDYLDTQRGHVTVNSGSLTRLEGSIPGAAGDYLAAAWANTQVLLKNLFERQTLDDYLIVRPGAPIVLAGVTCLAVIGLAALLPRLKTRWALFVVGSLIIQLGFPAVYLGGPFIRALLPAYPAIFIAAGFGLWAATERMPPGLGKVTGLGLASGTVLVLGVIGALAYFTETRGTPDGNLRRSLFDVIESHAGASSRLILPFVPSNGDFVDSDRNAIRFVVAGEVGGFDEVDSAYQLVDYAHVLTALQGPGATPQQVVVLQTKGGSPGLVAAVDRVKQAIEKCYTGVSWEQDRYFITAIIRESEARCSTGREIELLQAQDGFSQFAWIAPPESGPYLVSIERKADLVEDFEMEVFGPNGGWQGEARFARGFSGSGYLFDNLNAGTAVIQIPVRANGDYQLWIRTYKRRWDGGKWLFSIDGLESVEMAPGPSTPFDEWTWQNLGTYSLQAGQHTVRLSRVGSGPAIFIDVLYLSRNSSFHVGRSSLWGPPATTVIPEGKSGAVQSYRLDSRLPPGTYRVRVTSVSQGFVDGLGDPLASPFAEFVIPEP